MERKVLVAEYADDVFKATVNRDDSEVSIQYRNELNNEFLLAISDIKLFADFVVALAREEAAE